jgi:Ca2+-transporting ATPase
MQTEMGKIAGLLHESRPEATPLQRELDRTGKVLGGIVLAIAAVVVATILLVRQAHDLATVVDTLILGVALAVAAVPEGLPAIVTAVLALGVQRMARRAAIVRRLPSVETLGSATVIASDKTGTLTRNEMTVRVVATASGRVELSGTGYEPRGAVLQDGRPLHDPALRAELERALRAAELANNAALQQHDGQWGVVGDPTEGALVVAARKAGLEPAELDARFERVGEVPFSSERKLMSTAHRDAERERVVLCSKGALAAVLPRCSHELVANQARPLDERRRAVIRDCNRQMAGQALRTLALAFRSLPREALAEGTELDERAERELVFLGLVGMLDPPRPEAGAAVARARGAGVRPIMVTGDHPATAAAIARDLGIAADGRVIAGTELQELSEAELDRVVREVSVYARVDPEHKLRIVRALQRQGEVVAMTGDGVNDAPALRAADIGVAMALTGTDVAKEAADMVLADDNFATIVAAVEEGRAIFANIQKFLRYLLSSNVGEVLTMFLGVVLGGLLGLTGEGGALVLPLLATQILWINLVTDGPPALALGLDPADPDLMQQQPRARGSAVISGPMWAGIAFVGLIMAVGTLLVLDSGLPGGLIDNPAPDADQPLAYARTLAFTTLVLFQLFNVFNARSDSRSALPNLFRNRWLWGAVLLSLGLHGLAVYTPFLQGAFGTVALDGADWLRCALVASSVLWLRELWKLAQRRRASPSAAR